MGTPKGSAMDTPKGSVMASPKGSVMGSPKGSMASPKGSMASPPKLSPEEAERLRLERLSLNTANKIKSLQYQSPERNAGYEKSGVQPVGGFMKLLTPALFDASGDSEEYRKIKHRLLAVWIPDTIVWEPLGKPTWYYTNSDGLLLKTTEFAVNQIRKRFQRKQNPNEPVAVMKNSVGNARNVCTLVTTAKLKELVQSQGSPTSAVVMQRFVRPKGARANIYRCCWASSSNSVFRVNCIRSKHKMEDENVIPETRLLPSSAQADSIETFEMKAAGIPDIQQSMQNMIKYLAEVRRLLLDELVCDFLLDSCNRLWFLQVKAFTKRGDFLNAEPRRPLSVLVVDDPGPGVREFCGLCSCVFRLQDLRNVLTVRQVLEVHERLKASGIELSWAKSLQTLRLATRPSTVSGPMLRVCESCHSLHHALGELTAVSTAFHARLGCPKAPNVTDFTSMSVSSVSTRPPSTEAAVLFEPMKSDDTVRRSPSAPSSMGSGAATYPKPRMPSSWKCDMPSSDAFTVLRAHGQGVRASKSAAVVPKPSRQLLHRYRIFLLLQELVIFDPAAVPRDCCLFVTFTLFGVKHRIPVRDIFEQDEEPSSPHNIVRKVDSFRVIQVFVSQHESLAKWARKHAPVELRIHASTSGAGKSLRSTLFVTSLPLRRVVNLSEAHIKDPKNLNLALQDAEMEFLDLPLRRPEARVQEGQCRAVFGVSGGEVADCEGYDLRLESGLVYVPPQSFTLPQALPKRWMAVLTDDFKLVGQGREKPSSPRSETGIVAWKPPVAHVPQQIESIEAPIFILHFRLRGLHNLPGAQPADPYMVELNILGLVIIKQQTFCIERMRNTMGADKEVLAPMQLDASIGLFGLTPDSLSATLRREDAAYVKCVRRGGKSALCPALQVALPLDRLVDSGAKRITGAFELTTPADAPAGSTQNGELAHLFAGFSMDAKKSNQIGSDMPILEPEDERAERLAGVGSDFPPTLMLRSGGTAETELPETYGRRASNFAGAVRKKKPIVWRVSSHTGKRLSSSASGSATQNKYRSKRSIFRKARSSTNEAMAAMEEREGVLEGVEDTDEEEEEEEGGESELSLDITPRGTEKVDLDEVDLDGSTQLPAQAETEVDGSIEKTEYSKEPSRRKTEYSKEPSRRRTQYSKESSASASKRSKGSSGRSSSKRSAGSADSDGDEGELIQIIERCRADPRLRRLMAELPRQHLNRLRFAFSAFSSTRECLLGRVRVHMVGDVLDFLGYACEDRQLEEACREFVRGDEGSGISFPDFLVLADTSFRELIEYDPDEDWDWESKSSKESTEVITITI